jgi:DNA ligase-1
MATALLIDLVHASAAVRATASRLDKRALLAGYLRSLDAAAAPAAAAFLAGEIPGGRLGVGWRGVEKAASGDAPDEQSQLGLFPKEPPAGPLTLADVETAFDRVRHASGRGSAARRTRILVRLLQPASGEERSFLKRLILGELRQGALRALVLEAAAEAFEVPLDILRRAVMFAGDIREPVAALVLGGEEALRDIRLRPLVPVEPMLASPPPVDPASLFADAAEWAAEWKLDGVRIQVHRQGETTRVFTRRLRDVTAALPEVVEAAAGVPARSLILDGEVIAYEQGEPIPFQDLMSLVSRKRPADAPRPKLMAVFFDVLHRDGEPLVDAPYRERRSLLEELLPESRRIPVARVRSRREMESVRDAALAAGHEGIVLKNPESPYAAGRRGSHWIKVKPAETLDLVVLAAEWGSGRRRGWLSNLHLGARDARDPERFWMLGKTFKGLTDAMLRELTDSLPRIETRRDAYTVFVRPEFVVEVAFDGVQRSPRYDSGLALRFARVKRFRPDKDASQAATVAEVRGLGPPGRS